MAELINECNWERLKEEQNYDFASAGGVLYGTMFKKDYWDTTVLQMAEVPVVEEQPVTDPMTGAVLGYEPRQVLDPETGIPLTEKVHLGDVNTEVIEPYRMALDPLATDLHDPRGS